MILLNFVQISNGCGKSSRRVSLRSSELPEYRQYMGKMRMPHWKGRMSMPHQNNTFIASLDGTPVRSDDWAMMRLSAFADEISPELDEQIRVCRKNAVMHFELRTAYGKNVLDFDDALRKEIRSKLADNGMAAICIGSPIGKVKISEPWDAHFDRFKIAVDSAEFFGATLIRIFSYYAPEKGGDMRPFREEVMRRMGLKLEYVRGRNVVLVHENEREVYGEKLRECVDLMTTMNSPQFRFAFDFANFVQVGEKPLDNWPALKPYTAHIHIKDALLADGKVVPAGQGDGQIAPILVDGQKSGYEGFLSLEPHLKTHGQSGGFSGPELFTRAANALNDLCRKNHIALAEA
jgi:3-dehydroshikimate dehydratase